MDTNTLKAQRYKLYKKFLLDIVAGHAGYLTVSTSNSRPFCIACVSKLVTSEAEVLNS